MANCSTWWDIICGSGQVSISLVIWAHQHVYFLQQNEIIVTFYKYTAKMTQTQWFLTGVTLRLTLNASQSEKITINFNFLSA